tara:strand:+ start:823 stop:1398 length:576 start_codon:yes stop_codon:yes gene_type:complete
MLLQRGNTLLMYNSNEPENPNVNPMVFYSLDEYIQFYNEQKQQGNDCPVLYLQQEYDAQNKAVYRVRPSPFELDGGVSKEQQNQMFISLEDYADASRDQPPYNANNFPGFDPHGQYIGVYTELDAIHYSTETDPISDNSMDPNWGGVTHTKKSVDAGKYEGNVVTRPVLSTPKTSFYPSLPSNFQPPVDVL